MAGLSSFQSPLAKKLPMSPAKPAVPGSVVSPPAKPVTSPVTSPQMTGAGAAPGAPQPAIPSMATGKAGAMPGLPMQTVGSGGLTMTPPNPATAPVLQHAGGAPSPAGPPAISGVSVSPINPATGQGVLRGQSILPGGPTIDRTALANQALSDFDSANERGLRERFQSAGQHAASLGRLGMGDTAREVRDIGVDYDAQRARMAHELAGNLAESEVTDARSNRGEARGERSYQDALEGQGYDRRVQQYQSEQDAMNAAFLRNLQRYQVGASGNPASAELGVSGSLGQGADASANAMQQLLAIMARRGAGNGNTGITGRGLPSGTVLGPTGPFVG